MKHDVRQFYDTIGWSLVDDGVYQNARYEDLRPVSQEYISKCHLRVNRHLAPAGKYLLDAGSGPIQYLEYLTYSEGYQYRVCADLSITALKEARNKIGAHGLYVVADIANLPFKRDAFDGIVTLHTIHHLPLNEHARAYGEVLRVLGPGRSAVIVNGWSTSALMEPFRAFSRLRKKVWLWAQELRRSKETGRQENGREKEKKRKKEEPAPTKEPKKTFVEKHSPHWFKREIAPRIDAQILVWRSVNVHFTRFYIHEKWGGRVLLRWIYHLEEKYPHFFGEKGAYPLIVIRKPIK